MKKTKKAAAAKTKIALHGQTTIALGKLKGAEYNPRTMPDVEMKNLMRSLELYGFIQPVVVRDEDLTIIGGHQRVEAMRRLLTEAGEENIDAHEVPVVRIANIDDARAKLLNVALNRISGEWDYDKLYGIFSEIRELKFDDLDLDLSGFTDREIDNIFLLHEEPIALPEGAGGDAANEGLDEHAKRFGFTMGDKSSAQFCADVLKRFGMTGPGNASEAFLAALQAAFASAPDASNETGSIPPGTSQQGPKLQLDFLSQAHRDGVKLAIATASRKDEPAGETLARMLGVVPEPVAVPTRKQAKRVRAAAS